MRRVLLILVLLFTTALAACSYVTEFVVINESANPIEVTCKYRPIPGERPFEPYRPPAKMSADRLSGAGANAWQQLSPAQYVVDQVNRTATVQVMPGEALRVYSVHGYSGHEYAPGPEEYLIEEISVAGASGGLKYTGAMARTSFSKASRVLYTLTYK